MNCKDENFAAKKSKMIERPAFGTFARYKIQADASAFKRSKFL